MNPASPPPTSKGRIISARGCLNTFFAIFLVAVAGLYLFVGLFGGLRAKLATTTGRAMRIAEGLLLYSADNDGRLPAYQWQDSVRPFLFQERDHPEIFRESNGGENGFGMNRALLGVQIATVANPESTALIYISHQPGPNAVGGAEDVRFPLGWPYETETTLVMADGWRRWIKKKAFDPGVFRVELKDPE